MEWEPADDESAAGSADESVDGRVADGSVGELAGGLVAVGTSPGEGPTEKLEKLEKL